MYDSFMFHLPESRAELCCLHTYPSVIEPARQSLSLTDSKALLSVSGQEGESLILRILATSAGSHLLCPDVQVSACLGSGDLKEASLAHGHLQAPPPAPFPSQPF